MEIDPMTRLIKPRPAQFVVNVGGILVGKLSFNGFLSSAILVPPLRPRCESDAGSRIFERTAAARLLRVLRHGARTLRHCVKTRRLRRQDDRFRVGSRVSFYGAVRFAVFSIGGGTGFRRRRNNRKRRRRGNRGRGRWRQNGRRRQLREQQQQQQQPQV